VSGSYYKLSFFKKAAMTAEIVYIREDLIPGYRSACEIVARERIYLGRIRFPPLDAFKVFPLRIIENNWPMYCAMGGDVVVGWADIAPVDIPECAHRGMLGMGVLASHRGQGIGGRLLEACLAHAPRSNIEKVELTVYANNTAAIALYRKHGFHEIGTIRDFRRLDGVVYDALIMERFLR
jgi:ribosomal protein S18 acetylase RimI-like enzyme